jgi:hypothetical protein
MALIRFPDTFKDAQEQKHHHRNFGNVHRRLSSKSGRSRDPRGNSKGGDLYAVDHQRGDDSAFFSLVSRALGHLNHLLRAVEVSDKSPFFHL